MAFLFRRVGMRLRWCFFSIIDAADCVAVTRNCVSSSVKVGDF